MCTDVDHIPMTDEPGVYVWCTDPGVLVCGIEEGNDDDDPGVLVSGNTSTYIHIHIYIYLQYLHT